MNSMKKEIACVTGASGRVGKRLVNKLKKLNFKVRVLQYRKPINDDNLEIYHGSLDNEKVIEDFLTGAQYFFHFAAEVIDRTAMWKVNVKATEKLVRIANSKNLKYFCYLSSANVVGRVGKKEIDEETYCRPKDIYGKSKFEAERIVFSGIKKCQVIALRPVDIIDERNFGFLESLNLKSLRNRFKLFLRGNELAHLVHTDDVVNAALYFIGKRFDGPECFFLAYDEDSHSTFSGLQLLYDSFRKAEPVEKISKHFTLPIIVPNLMRSIIYGKKNPGNVKYSSKKILSYGFKYQIGLSETVKRYWENQN